MKKIIWILLILIVLGGGYYFLKMKSPISNKENYNSTQEMNTSTSTNSSIVATSTTSTTTKAYTFSEIASHSSKDSCWSAISGKVYDLTSFIGRHPGG